MDALAIFKCVALLQLAAVHAKASHDGNAAGQVPTSLHGSPSATGDIAAADHDAQAVQANASKAVQVDQLLPDLQPCISLLAGVRSSAPAQALRTQASLALQQVLHALNPPVCQACLRELLCRDEVHGGVHPEVAAILMQEVRVLLANHTGGHFFTLVF